MNLVHSRIWYIQAIYIYIHIRISLYGTNRLSVSCHAKVNIAWIRMQFFVHFEIPKINAFILPNKTENLKQNNKRGLSPLLPKSDQQISECLECLKCMKQLLFGILPENKTFSRVFTFFFSNKIPIFFNKIIWNIWICKLEKVLEKRKKWESDIK